MHNVSEHRKYCRGRKHNYIAHYFAYFTSLSATSNKPNLSSLKFISQCLISNYFAMNRWNGKRPMLRISTHCLVLSTKANITSMQADDLQHFFEMLPGCWRFHGPHPVCASLAILTSCNRCDGHCSSLPIHELYSGSCISPFTNANFIPESES
jgi:hypothetical protein